MLVIIILLALLDVAFLILVNIIGVLGFAFKILLSICGIAFIIGLLIRFNKYIQDNKEKIKNSKSVKIAKSVLKIMLVISIILSIIGVILAIVYKNTYTATIEDYIGKYDEDVGDWWHYDLTIEKNNKCIFVASNEDEDNFDCSYNYNEDSTLTLTIYDKDAEESYDFDCEYNFKTIIEHTYSDNDYIYCTTNDKTENIRPEYFFDKLQ